MDADALYRPRAAGGAGGVAGDHCRGAAGRGHHARLAQPPRTAPGRAAVFAGIREAAAGVTAPATFTPRHLRIASDGILGCELTFRFPAINLAAWQHRVAELKSRPARTTRTARRPIIRSVAAMGRRAHSCC